MTFIAKHISVSINRSSVQVYEFALNPENLPKWAAGLSSSIKKVDEDWIAESPMGRAKVNSLREINSGFSITMSLCRPELKSITPAMALNWFLRYTAGQTCQIKNLRKMPRR